jgi:hypothetical protein
MRAITRSPPRCGVSALAARALVAPPAAEPEPRRTATTAARAAATKALLALKACSFLNGTGNRLSQTATALV